MLAFGTDYDYYNAVWVKNEWSRFLQLIARGEKKTLIPCFKNLDAYDMPKEFAKLQAQDLGRVGANQDLLRGIRKILPKKEEAVKEQSVPQLVVQQAVQGGGPNVAALLMRGEIALKKKQWQEAIKYFDQVLNIEATNPDALLGIELANAGFTDREFLLSALVSKRYYDTTDLSFTRHFANPTQDNWWARFDVALEKNKADMIQKRDRCLLTQGMISARAVNTVGLKIDGSVLAVGRNGCGQCRVLNWSDIKAVSAGRGFIVGLKCDGTVVATKYTGGQKNYCGECNVSSWQDIVSVSAGYFHTVGVKADGTVVATDFIGDLKDYNGQCDVSSWQDIMSVSAGYSHTVGLKTDGTVVATKYTGNQEMNYGQCDVSEWQDIVSVAAGPRHTVGLKADGTVVSVGNNETGQCNVSEWRDIVAVAAGSHHTVGLTSMGNVVATQFVEGKFLLKSAGQCDVSNWQDIVAIAAGHYHTVGLKSDGTVVAVGSNSYGACDVSSWRLFRNIETIEQERLEADQRNRRELPEKLAAASQCRAAAKTELANLKGLFTGKRRKELEAEIARMDEELRRMQKQLDTIKD